MSQTTEEEKSASSNKIRWVKRIITLVLGIAIWNLPVPWDLSPDAWHLFAIFITAIIGVLIEAVSIFTA